MNRRLRARLALLRVWWEQTERDLDAGFSRVFAVPARFLAWLWNGFKALPGVHQVGHGLATVLGLYRLDRWLVAREIRADLRLADHLAAAGLSDQADLLRTAAARRRLAR